MKFTVEVGERLPKEGTTLRLLTFIVAPSWAVIVPVRALSIVRVVPVATIIFETLPPIDHAQPSDAFCVLATT
jgi:hypothetical protein